MYPVLYKKDETNFTHNGLGVLKDAISVLSEEELNGYFELTVQYEAEGFLADEVKNGMILKVKANDKQDPQLFRIYSNTKDHNTGQIIINAQHITYDLADNFVEKLELTSATTRQAMVAIQENLSYPTRFNINSSNSTTISNTKLYRMNPLQMIAGTDGSILDHWGGQIERDNFNLMMHRRRGSDDGVSIIYKKNLTGLQASIDDSKVVTRIFPFKYDDETDTLITIDEKYIDSPNIDMYPTIKILPLDFSGDQEIENKTDLYNASKDYFKTDNKDLPQISMDVEFEPLWHTEEYKDVAALELVGLGDTVSVYHSKLNIDIKATVVKVDYDSITEKNHHVSLGNIKAGLTDAVRNANDIVQGIGDKINQANEKANEAIRAANGKNTIYQGPDEPVENLIEGDLWFRTVDGQYTRTYRFDGIEWQLIVSVDAMDAKDTAQEAKNRADQAVANANLATSNAIEAIEEAQGAFDQAQNAMTKANSAFDNVTALSEVVDEHSGEISSIKQTAQGLQTKVTNAEGNISTLQQTANSLGSRLSNSEDEISALTQTAQGLQTEVSNKADKSVVTQLAGVVDSKITRNQADGWYASQSQLTQTASSLQSTITSVRNDLDGLEIGGRNFLLNTTDDDTLFDFTGWNQKIGDVSDYGVKELSKGGDFTFSMEVTSRTSGNEDITMIVQMYRSDNTFRQFYADTRLSPSETGMVEGIFSIPKDEYVRATASVRHYSGSASQSIGTYSKAYLQKGNKLADWQPAPEDMATQSQISQLSDSINLRVKENDVINQINLSTESILISGNKLILDGDTTVRGTFRVNNANITSVNAGKITAGTLDAGRVNVINLSANSIVGGILQSQNSNTTFNLNSGEFYLNNNNITFGSSASINFEDPGNTLTYRKYDSSDGFSRSAGVGVGDRIGGRYPFAYLGTTGASTLDSLSPFFSGFIANSTAATGSNDAANSVNGWIFQMRSTAVNWIKGLEFDFNGNPTIRPYNGHQYNYNLGTHDHMFNDLHIRRIYTIGGFDIFNNSQSGVGWRLTTIEESGRVAFRGLNGGSFNYDLGASESYNHFHFGYVNNLRGASSASTSVGLSSNPYTYGHFNTLTVHSKLWANDITETSDLQQKTNIVSTILGLSFINTLKPVDFVMIDSPGQKTGFIAQDVEKSLSYYKFENQSIVSENSNGILGISYTQLIAPTIKAVQEIDVKVDRQNETIYQLEKQKEKMVLQIAEIEERLNKLEVA
ncbi:phage tail spike protein [Oceanobacillus iheyensis]|uniref:phage tail spike protein n=1 Tax=Oceanobacillus iheyensis TaxID=182710 RepID=UPI003641E8B4